MSPTFPSVMKLHLPHHGSQACQSDTMVTHTYMCRPISTITLNSCCVEGAANPRLPCFCPLRLSDPDVEHDQTVGEPRAALTLHQLLFREWPQPQPAPHPKHTHKTMSYTAFFSSSSSSSSTTGFPKPPHLSLAPMKYIIEALFVICRYPWVHPEAQNKCTRGLVGGRTLAGHTFISTCSKIAVDYVITHTYICTYICVCVCAHTIDQWLSIGL